MSDSLYLIDGHSLIYQSYYALPGLVAPDGRPTGAVYGFLRFLDKLVRERAPGRIVVVVDSPKPTFRHKTYPDYKKTRKPMPDDLRGQVPLLREILEARGVPVVEHAGVEADDVLGTLTRTGTKKGVEICIVSRDKDLKQLLGPGVTLLDPRTETLFEAEDFEKETGLAPSLFPDLIGLAGDVSDNIPGVPGIGEKTALALLREFGDIESVLAGWEKVKGGKRKANLRDFADQARLSRDLAVIKTDVPITTRWKDIAPAKGDPERVEALYRELGFGTLVTAVKESSGERDYRTVDRPGFESFLAELKKQNIFAFDLETTGTDPIGSDLVGLSFSFRAGEAFYVPVRAPKAQAALIEGEVLEALSPLFSDPLRGKVGHNLKFDATVLLRRGIEVRGIAFDTLVEAYLLNPGRRALSLDALAAELLHLKTIPITDLIGEGKEQTTLDRVDLARVSEYACEDADVAWRLREALAPRIETEGLSEVFRRAEMPLVGILTAMETEGVVLDVARLEGLDGEVAERMASIEKDIYKAAKEEFNMNSPKQLRVILYEKLGLPVLKKTKTGPSTDADVLKQLADEHPLPGLIMEYRVLKKLQSTYIRSLPKGIHQATGRLHASFNQTVAATGRLSSSNPNLQNIPTRTELGRRIREAFVPSKGSRFLTADYSQIELRIMAHLSGDEELRRAFRDGEDIHTAVGSEIFGVEPSGVDKSMRFTAKAVNFGILYGQSAFGLARELGIPHKEAQSFIDRYFGKYAGVKAFVDELVSRAREEARVRTMLGRVRFLPEIKSSNHARRAFAERTAVNTVIQGSAADLIKLAMIDVVGRIREGEWPAKLLVQIHDELLFEVEAGALDPVREEVVAGMEGAMDLEVPLKANWAVGDNWMEL